MIPFFGISQHSPPHSLQYVCISEKNFSAKMKQKQLKWIQFGLSIKCIHFSNSHERYAFQFPLLCLLIVLGQKRVFPLYLESFREMKTKCKTIKLFWVFRLNSNVCVCVSVRLDRKSTLFPIEQENKSKKRIGIVIGNKKIN